MKFVKLSDIIVKLEDISHVIKDDWEGSCIYMTDGDEHHTADSVDKVYVAMRLAQGQTYDCSQS